MINVEIKIIWSRWSEQERQSLLREPWVAETALMTYRNVYANKTVPPIANNYFELIVFGKMIQFLTRLVRNKIIPNQILDEAKALQQRGRELSLVPDAHAVLCADGNDNNDNSTSITTLSSELAASDPADVVVTAEIV